MAKLAGLNLQLLPESASVLVLLTYYGTFAVGPFITSFVDLFGWNVTSFCW